jgi:hypothetical protein
MTAADPTARPTAVTVGRALRERVYKGLEDEPTQPVAPVDDTAAVDPPTQVYPAFSPPAPDEPATATVSSPVPEAGAAPASAPASPAPAPFRRQRRSLPGAVLVALAVVIVVAALAIANLSDKRSGSTDGQPAVVELKDALDNLEESVG